MANDSPSLSVRPSPPSQGPVEVPGMPPCPDVIADIQELGPGSRGSLFTVWCPQSVQGPSDLVGWRGWVVTGGALARIVRLAAENNSQGQK